MSGSWSKETIAGHPVDLYEPQAGTRPRFVLVFLHPYGLETVLAEEFTRQFDAERLACVSPLTGGSWWADRVCPEFDPVLTAHRHLLDNVLPFIRERFGIGPPGIGLFGISMGGQGALRLGFQHPELFPVVAGISSAIDYHELYSDGLALDDMYDSKEQCRQDTALLHIHPNHYPPHLFFCIDPADAEWHRGNDRLHEKLNALGIPHECDLTTRAGGHSWRYFNSMAERTVRFLVAGLEQMSRRLL